jgi:hypothetical protein
MGGTFSTPVNLETPTVLNFILTEMFRRSDLVDIYSLADSARCSRYVVAGGDALEKLFVKLRIYPIKGKDGIIYFQSLDGLAKAMPKNIKDKQRENCIELSFFFIRIFQIFGAVALSMFDNSIPLTDPVPVIPVDKTRGKQSIFLSQSNFGGVPVPQKSKSWFGFGGALLPADKTFYIPDGSYKILNYHLYKPDGGSQTLGPMKMEGYEMYMDQSSFYDITQSGGQVTDRKLKVNPAPLIKYTYVRNSNQYTLTAILNIEGLDELTVRLKNYSKDGVPSTVSTNSELLKAFAGDKPVSLGQGYPSTKGKSLPSVLYAMFDEAATKMLGALPFSTVKFLRKMNYISGPTDSEATLTGTHITLLGSQENAEKPRIVYRNSVTLGTDSKSISLRITGVSLQVEEPIADITDGSYSYRVYIDFSNAVIQPPEAADYINLKSYKSSKFVAYSKTGVPKSESTDLTIPAYLEGIFQGLTKPDKDVEGGIRLTREGLPQPYDSESIPPDLRIKDLWKALAKDPPIKSHCIARAIQLLSVDAIRGNMSKQAFSSACSVNFAYQKDGSLPEPGKKLSDVYGMHTLATLFWTDFEKQMPKLQDEAKYKDFLKFMKMNLEGYENFDKTPQPEKLSSIVEKSPEVCDERVGSKLQIPGDLARRLRDIVKALQQKQASHISAGMHIMEMLFDMPSITQRKVFAFNPTVMAGGMPEVNRIAAEARNVLMKYYSGCETTYRDGLKLIYESNQQRPLVAVNPDGSIIVPKVSDTTTAVVDTTTL